MTASPLALPFPAMPALPGVTIGTATVPYKRWTRDCVTLVALAPGTVVAGVTTRSRCPSPEVELCRAKLAGGRARGLVVNAGNSNAFTGMTGRQAAQAQAARAAQLLGCDPAEVFSASTGVIGVPLPVDLALDGVDKAHARLGQADWLAATNAIGTTDTFAKGATCQAIIGGTRVTLNGIIKGSGMIAPDMATMLGFIFTDAAITPALWPPASTASPWMATPAHPIRCWPLPPARPAMRRWPAWTMPAPMRWPLRWPICAASLPCWWCAMAKAPAG
jgi:glutamate N-acetyltransferase/amino-acid N-acetyltransferase